MLCARPGGRRGVDDVDDDGREIAKAARSKMEERRFVAVLWDQEMLLLPLLGLLLLLLLVVEM